MHAIKHFMVITRHRHKVIGHCFKAGIFFQGLKHDLSKYSSEEFGEGAKYFQGTRSPNEAAREKNGFSRAWMHHKGRNKHHFEYWTDYNPTAQAMVPVKMPVKYVAEMFCDRVAASKIYKGKYYTDRSTLDYYVNAKQTRLIHPDTASLLENWLITLAEDGEKKAFRDVREAVRMARRSKG